MRCPPGSGGLGHLVPDARGCFHALRRGTAAAEPDRGGRDAAFRNRRSGPKPVTGTRAWASRPQNSASKLACPRSSRTPDRETQALGSGSGRGQGRRRSWTRTRTSKRSDRSLRFSNRQRRMACPLQPRSVHIARTIASDFPRDLTDRAMAEARLRSGYAGSS